MLLGIAYFPPVSYFALIAKGMVLSPENTIPSIVYIEACENYQKQSWRNRCEIMAADGPAFLNFPIVHEGSHDLPITRIKVDYSTPWVLKTERAISSAYESSAYFDYYKDELYYFYPPEGQRQVCTRVALLYEMLRGELENA